MIDYGGLLEGFRKVGIKLGDTILVHSSYKSLGGVVGGAETIINALEELVGAEGTLIFPAFNFNSWTEEHYFDILETPSQMGIITELARHRTRLGTNAIRTPHPIYSFSVLGKYAKEFYETDDPEAYGNNSAFSLFHKLNGTIVSIGLDFNHSFSMQHYIEYRTGCDYRRVKEFSGIYMGYDRTPKIKKYSMFVRLNDTVKTDIIPGMNELLDGGGIKEINIGKAKVHYMTANEFFDNMAVIIKEHPEKLHHKEKKKM